MALKQKIRIGDLLVSNNVITEDQLQQVLVQPAPCPPSMRRLHPTAACECADGYQRSADTSGHPHDGSLDSTCELCPPGTVRTQSEQEMPASEIVARLDTGQIGVIDANLPTAHAPTPYARFGDWTSLVLICAAWALAFAVGLTKRRPNTKY